MIVKNLESEPTHSVVIAAYVEQLEDSGSWYYNLTIDGLSNIGSILSKQYSTYDEAVYGMNERIVAMYEDVSG
jgi:hypothetical protein